MSVSPAPKSAEVKPFPVSERQVPAVLPDEAPHVAPPANNDAKAAKPAPRSFRKPIILTILLAGAAYAGWNYAYPYWTDGRFMVTTDDSYIQADIAAISPKVSGYIKGAGPVENATVKAGDVLFTIDDGDYQLALDLAEAQIASHTKTLERVAAQKGAAEAGLVEAQAAVQAAQAAAHNAEQSMQRATELRSTGVGSKATSDTATTAFDQATAALAGANAKIESAKANIAVLAAQYAETESAGKALELQRDKAKRDLSFTIMRAPFDGIVGNLAGQEGDLVSPGQKLAALVPTDKLYVDANYKETQLGKIKVGEVAKFTVDALPDETFTGKVISIAPASGAVFSLLPPENATGNFTKVVQRVPVRIEIPAELLAKGELRAGLSVSVAIDSRTAPNN
jgi:membrane fusion protein, multidrug efflux system